MLGYNMHMSLFSKKRGFTLIELLVVIAIIGILSSIIMVSLSSAKARSRDAKRVADIKNIQLALDLYFNDNGVYPASIYGASGLAPNYLPVVPKDPNYTSACTTGAQISCYTYVALSPSGAACGANAFRYHLGTALEQTSNNALTQDVDSVVNPVIAGLTYQACPTSGVASDFSGLSAAASASQQCLATAGTAQPSGTENCYDMTP